MMPETLTTPDEAAHELEAAFRRAIARRIITAAEVVEHLARNGWTDLWQAFQASTATNWYSVRDALRGHPGHQKTLRSLLALPVNTHP